MANLGARLPNGSNKSGLPRRPRGDSQKAAGESGAAVARARFGRIDGLGFHRRVRLTGAVNFLAGTGHARAVGAYRRR